MAHACGQSGAFGVQSQHRSTEIPTESFSLFCLFTNEDDSEDRDEDITPSKAGDAHLGDFMVHTPLKTSFRQ